MFIPQKIISTGDSGARIGGIVGAQRCDIPTGGVSPAGFMTAVGPKPILGKRFGLITHPWPEMAPSIMENIKTADSTVIFSTNVLNDEIILAVNFLEKESKIYCIIDPFSESAVATLSTFLENKKPKLVKQIPN